MTTMRELFSQIICQKWLIVFCWGPCVQIYARRLLNPSAYDALI